MTAPLLRREAVVLGALAASVAAVAMAVLVTIHGREWLFRNDAEFFWVVARNPFGDGAMFRPVAEETGNAYRYGRVLYPLVAWLLAVGRESLVEWTLMLVDVIAFGAVVALGAELVARRGRPARLGLVALLSPAMWGAMVLAVSEPFVIALILLAFLLWLDGRRRAALASVACALLAREAAALAFVPLAVVDIRRDMRRVAVWAATVVPLLVWWTWVRFRVGEWPFLDSSVSRREALAAPFAGLVGVWHEGVGFDHWVAVVLAAGTIAASGYVVWRRVWFPVSHGAAALAVLVVFFGPNAWRFPGEVIRLLGPPQVLTLLAFAGSRRE